MSRLFGGQIQPAGFRAGGHDQGAGLDPFVIDVQAKRTLREIGRNDFAIEVDCAETLGLLPHVLDQIGAVDTFGKAGEILDFRGQRKLAANLQALDNKGLKPGSGSVDSGGVSGATGTDNHDIMHMG